MAKTLKQDITIENNLEISFLDNVQITTSDIDFIASRIAVRKLLRLGWKVSDLNNINFPYDIFGGDARRDRSLMSTFVFSLNRPYLLFRSEWHNPRNNKYIIGKSDMKLPRDLVRLILRLKPTGNFRYFPVDYLITNSNDFIFVEQKTNSAKISEKQLKVSKIIQDAGYKVAELHVSVSLGSKAEVECRELRVVDNYLI